MKQFKNQHEWGVVAQCKNPYREFHFCPLCRQYTEASATKLRMTPKTFKALVISLKDSNPVYNADSNDLMPIEEK